MPQNKEKETEEPPEVEKRKDGSEKEKNEKRSYYYDDAHGYEDYDPNCDSEDNEDESRSGFRPVDVDGNISPPPLIETDEGK